MVCVSQIFLLSAVTLGTVFPINNSNLLSVVQVFRHGQRTPADFYKNDPYSSLSYWPAAPGELVNEGKEQQYELGEFTRQRYNGYLPERYNPSDIYVQSSYMDRCYMSALSYLAGLYPPVGEDVWNSDLLWQPIPVHPQDLNRIYPNCPNFYPLLNEINTNEKLYMNLNEEFKDIYEYVSNHSGAHVNSTFDAWRIYDTLWIEELNGYDLPEWTEKVYPEPLFNISSYAMRSLAYTVKMKKICTGLFFNDLLKYFENRINSSSSYKFKVYSGHDLNIASLLETMGAFIPHIPAFSSSIIFELRKIQKKYFVHIWHKDNEDFKSITVKGCKLSCPLEKFKQLLAGYIINADEYDSLCAVGQAQT